MKIRNVKSAPILEKRKEPSIKKCKSCKNLGRILIPTISINNLSPIKQKEEINSQKYQNSMMSFDISFKEDLRKRENYENYTLNKKILISKEQYNKIFSDIIEIENKFMNNNYLIEKYKKDLENLKIQKRQNQSDVVNLLSNKESLEEIYKIKISSLIKDSNKSNNKRVNNKSNNKRVSSRSNNLEFNNNNKQSNNINNNNNNDDEENPFSTINILEDNEDIDINLDDLKLMDKKIFEEQLINLTEDIAQKKNLDTRKKLLQKLKIGYQVLTTQLNSNSCIDSEIIISNFFSRISIFISNINKGKYSQELITKFLKILIKINCINIKISEMLKFLNKVYKDKKNEIKEKIYRLNEKNEYLKNKKATYETKKNELKKYIDDNNYKVKINERNKTLINDNKGGISYILNTNFQDDLDFLNDDKTCEMSERININDNTNLEEKNDVIKNNNSNKDANVVNDKIINKNKLFQRKKNLSRNKVLNMSNYKIKGKMNKKYIGIHDKNPTQFIGELSSFTVNKNPFNNLNKAEIYDNNEKNVNKTINSINVNNLIINNNLNFDDNNRINNNTTSKEGKEEILYNSNTKINTINHYSRIGGNKKFYNSNSTTRIKRNLIPSNKTRVIMLKDIQNNSTYQILTPKRKNLFLSPKNLYQFNNRKKIIFPHNNSYAYAKSISPLHQNTLYNSNTNKSSIDTRYNALIEDIPECFCYFKILEKGNLGFNPFNINDANLNKFNYFEGSILFDKVFNKLKILQKSEKKYIGIELKDIIDVYLDKQMENISKVYNIYLKYKKIDNNFDINKFINSKEINDIHMQQNEKINAINCKFFNFSIIMKKRFVPKVEFIFYNFKDFNLWYNCLLSIVKLNNDKI